MKNIKGYLDFLNEGKYHLTNFLNKWDKMSDEEKAKIREEGAKIKAERTNVELNTKTLKSLLDGRFGNELGSIDSEECSKLLRFIKKKLPDVTPLKLTRIFKYVGNTVDYPSKNIYLEIALEIENYYGL